jgi:hypothetical protein
MRATALAAISVYQTLPSVGRPGDAERLDALAGLGKLLEPAVAHAAERGSRTGEEAQEAVSESLVFSVLEGDATNEGF